MEISLGILSCQVLGTLLRGGFPEMAIIWSYLTENRIVEDTYGGYINLFKKTIWNLTQIKVSGMGSVRIASAVFLRVWLVLISQLAMG